MADITKFKESIQEAKKEIFIEPETASNLEALGIITSAYCEWDGRKILEVLASALEDANYHSECLLISKMLESKDLRQTTKKLLDFMEEQK